MNKHRLYPYIFLLLPYVVVMILMAICFRHINIVTYLLLMICPIFTSSMLFAVATKKYSEKVSSLLSSLVAVTIYLVFYMVVLFFMKQTNTMEFIYQNSKGLFSEGFSIGSEMQFTPGDAILPILLTFITHYGCMAIAHKKPKNEEQ
ncbi:MAG: hypothetical protein J1E60_01105 [Christensenellaceae bacterium]|nr:hypothetical protein [Christensenellaceae bacterium]